MALFRTLAPDVEPVTVDELKQVLRVEHDSENDLIAGLIRAAREEVEASCGLALIAQGWRMTLDRVPRSGRVLLRRHPVRSIGSVTVYGADGEASLVDPGTYRLDAHNRPARLHFLEVPTSVAAMNGIEIDFAAGFGEAGTDVPDLIKRALTTLATHWFEFRAAHPDMRRASFPSGYERLLAPWRERRL